MLMEENEDNMGKIGLLEWMITLLDFRFFFCIVYRYDEEVVASSC